MDISYNKLWKLMIDKNINKTMLRTFVGITSNTMDKLGNNESVQPETLVKICNVLGCNIGDTCEITSETQKGDYYEYHK